jgi:flagellar hook protein FlgE
MVFVCIYAGARSIVPGNASQLEEHVMIYPVNPAVSALTAFRKKMNVTANNIANVNTDQFKKSRVNMQEDSNGGVSSQVQKIQTPGPAKEVYRAERVEEVESSNVDLAEELTEMIPTQAAYTANIQSLRTSDKMLGSLLDIMG